MSMRAPVGSTPHSGPRSVPAAVQCTAERSPSATRRWTSSAKSGNAANISVKYARTPLGPDGVDLAGDVLLAVGGPQFRHRVDVAAGEGVEVVSDGLTRAA